MFAVVALNLQASAISVSIPKANTKLDRVVRILGPLPFALSNEDVISLSWIAAECGTGYRDTVRMIKFFFVRYSLRANVEPLVLYSKLYVVSVSQRESTE